MPELWIPYGTVETLVTIQAENLGAVAEPKQVTGSLDVERVTELAKSSAKIFICDATPPTLELIRAVAPALGDLPGKQIYSAAPRRVEPDVPELKGRIATLPPPLPTADGQPVYAPELLGGPCLFIGSARPDPMIGMIDARVEACLNWIGRAKSVVGEARKEMEPSPFQKTEAYEALEGLASNMQDAKFVTVVPSGGRAKAALEDPPFDAVKSAFERTPMPPGRGMVIGTGGRGYDDSLSSAIRGVWNVIEGVRKAGSILLMAECSEGVGSTALELLVTGRMAEKEKRRGYVDGMEDVFYLSKLKSEYDVLLLSGLPETYASSKLGLATAKGSGEAIGRVLNRVGRSGKINVVPRAAECFVESG